MQSVFKQVVRRAGSLSCGRRLEPTVAIVDPSNPTKVAVQSGPSRKRPKRFADLLLFMKTTGTGLKASPRERNTEFIFMPGYNGLLYSKGDDCKKLGKGKKAATICQAPADKHKPIPPYDYGYCKEEEVPPLTSCPAKPKKSSKGPCCKQEGGQKKGTCRK